MEKSPLEISCPIPISDYPNILLAHGGGGRLMQQLLEKIFFAAFGNPILDLHHDSALIHLEEKNIAMTTDSYVVHPLFFPGGDIGSLAVYGTVNDLAMAGAQPRYISAGFILEEGLPLATLWRIVLSMKEAAQKSGVQIVTGDTKVVERGKGDGIFINTTGVGILPENRHVTPQSIQAGDVILLNGDIGRHGMAIMASREGLEFETTLASDSAPLNGLVESLFAEGMDIHCLRDLTRGGLASVLVELSEASNSILEIEAEKIPVSEAVQSACEILGLDPLYVANEGRMVLMIPAGEAQRALEILKKHPQGGEAVRIGRVREKSRPQVILNSKIGVPRVIDLLSGEQLPRIC
jgi:hydrogenase expression/formation protein HypE